MDFRNTPFMFVLGGGVALFVTVQSLMFIVRAWKEGRRLGLTVAQLKKAVAGSAVFTIVPSVSILLTLLTLSGSLGLALPWIRLSVIGAITYELPAAESAAAAFGASINQPVTDPAVFSSIAWVMTLGIFTSLIFTPLMMKRIERGLHRIQTRDQRWSQIFMAALFVGMISSFLGMAVSGGPVAILVLLTSAAIMAVCALLIKKARWGWLENFALPLSMIGSMCLAIVYSNLLG